MLKMEYTNIDQKINSIENTMKSLMNKNTVVYSNHSKTSDTLSNGICSLTINSINKSFILHTHTVCVTYYKASPYNISHTKNIFTAKYNRVIYANTIILKLHMHINKASISMNF